MSDLSKLLDAIATIQFNLGYLQAQQEKTREEIDAMKARIERLENVINNLYMGGQQMSQCKPVDAIGREVVND